jgi:5-methylcytosine-specific restriction endonuclease McrA
MGLAFTISFGGNNNPSWRGGRWQYKGKGWRNIKREIMQRDKCCQQCGTNKRLVIHHIIPQRFWMLLEDANISTNLIALCRSCHAKRTEHYWVFLPDDFFNPTYHNKTPIPRTPTRLHPKPKCQECGAPVKWARNRFCSYTCSNKSRWKNGIYKGLGKNFKGKHIDV